MDRSPLQPLSQPQPSLASLTFTSPPEAPHHFVHLISSLLSESECAAIIAAHRNLVPSNVTPGTVRLREVFEDAELAKKLWERVRGFYLGVDDGEGGEEGGRGFGKGPGRVVDEDGEVWVMSGLNEIFRLCLYEEGGKFSPHTDGRRLASLNSQSFMTLNMYLNTVPLSSGGATRFLSSSHPTVPGKQTVLGSSQPVMGSAAVFRDDLWHDGQELSSGQKWLLRTDIMFKRQRDFDWDVFCAERGWVCDVGSMDERVEMGETGERGEMSAEKREKKGRKALGFAEGLEDAGCSGEAVRWYKVAFREWPALERGG